MVTRRPTDPGDKVDYLVTVAADGHLRLEWEIIVDELRKLHHEANNPFGFLTVIGERKAGKTSLVENIIENSIKLASIPFDDSVKSRSQSGVSLRFQPILIPEDGTRKALYCLDTFNKGRDSAIEAKLLQFCIRISSTLIVIFDDKMDHKWMENNFKESFKQDAHLPLSRNLVVLHKKLLAYPEDKLKLLPYSRHSMDEFFSECEAQTHLDNDISSVKKFAEFLTTFYTPSASYVFLPEEFLKHIQKSATEINFYNTVYSNGCVLCEDNVPAHQDRMTGYLKTNADALAPFHRQNSRADKAQLNETNFLKIRETVNRVFGEVSKKEREKLRGSSVFIPKLHIQKFQQDVEAKSLEEVKNSLPAHLKHFRFVIKDMVDEKITVYLQNYHQLIRNQSLIKAAFREAALDYLLGYVLAVARGDELGVVMKNLPKLETVLLSKSKGMDGFATFKSEMENKVYEFKTALTKAHTLLCNLDERLKSMLNGSVCVTYGTVDALRAEVGNQFKNTNFKGVDEKLESSFDNLLTSVEVMLISRFERANALNIRFETVLAKRAKEESLEKYQNYMSSSLGNTCLSSPEFNRFHEEAKNAMLKCFRPTTQVHPSFVWSTESTQLNESIENLRHVFEKRNAQNCAAFESKRKKVVNNSLNFFLDELEKSKEGNLHARIISTRSKTFDFFKNLVQAEREEYVEKWAAELEAAIDKEMEERGNGSGNRSVAHSSSTETNTCSHSEPQRSEIPENSSTAPSAIIMTKDYGIQRVADQSNTASSTRMNSLQSKESKTKSLDHQASGSGESVIEDSNNQNSYLDDPLKTAISELIENLRDKLSSSTNTPGSMKSYIEEQIQEAIALLKNPSAKKKRLEQVKGFLEGAVEKI